MFFPLSDLIRNPLVTFRTEKDAVRVFSDLFDLHFVRSKKLITQDAANFHRSFSPAFYRFKSVILPFPFNNTSILVSGKTRQNRKRFAGLHFWTTSFLVPIPVLIGLRKLRSLPLDAFDSWKVEKPGEKPGF